MKALIIANGTLPEKLIIQSIIKSIDYIVCADGGANLARRLGIRPDIILGDLDSITAATKKYFHTVEIRHIRDQNSTDLEKAISFCIREKYRTITIIGATGSRIDHSTGALGCFKKYRKKAELVFVDTVGVLTAIGKQTVLSAKKGERISLIPLERCEGVTTTNLKYRLNNDFLELGVREGISNFAIGNDVKIKVRKGVLLLYRFRMNA